MVVQGNVHVLSPSPYRGFSIFHNILFFPLYHGVWQNFSHLPIWLKEGTLLQWKHAGPIIQRSVDRNFLLLLLQGASIGPLTMRCTYRVRRTELCSKLCGCWLASKDHTEWNVLLIFLSPFAPNKTLVLYKLLEPRKNKTWKGIH